MAMYNRYTPNQDGSYQKDRMPEHRSAPAKSNSQQCASEQSAGSSGHCTGKNDVRSVLETLLPGGIDTGDLLMLLIVLLLLRDGSEEAPSALLTIALFFLLGD